MHISINLTFISWNICSQDSVQCTSHSIFTLFLILIPYVCSSSSGGNLVLTYLISTFLFFPICFSVKQGNENVLSCCLQTLSRDKCSDLLCLSPISFWKYVTGVLDVDFVFRLVVVELISGHLVLRRKTSFSVFFVIWRQFLATICGYFAFKKLYCLSFSCFIISLHSFWYCSIVCPKRRFSM